MGKFALPLAVLGLLVLLALVMGAGFILRRYLLTRMVGTFDCSLRRDGRPSGGWMLGVARYEADRLEWFRIFTMNPRPGRTLARSRLNVVDRRKPGRSEGYAVMPGSVIVRCSYSGVLIDLAMSEGAYNGFATWLESAPPGTPIFVE